MKRIDLWINERNHLLIVLFIAACLMTAQAQAAEGLVINDQDYFEMPGLNVLVYHNTYPEGHQGGVEIIQHGDRVATCGEVRLSAAPGQWQPVPKLGEGFQKRGPSPLTVSFESRKVDREKNEITMPCSYPDESRARKGFNPIIYPDLDLKYSVRVKADGPSFTISVDLDEPLPAEWVGRVSYNLELFPANLYGKMYAMDGQTGIFPRQAEGPTYLNEEGEAEAEPLAEGMKLVVAPESELFRMTIESKGAKLKLLDGSLKHNNGWFVVRSLIPAGATKDAVVWHITPHVIPNWKYPPVVHVSQVGYHPNQPKMAVIEQDKQDTEFQNIILQKVTPAGEYKTVRDEPPKPWGQFMRYQYGQFDFSDVREPGIYVLKYGDFTTAAFQIKNDIYKRHVWQPTLEYFLPVQMCHMRVNQKYRIWHGACHLDDALMAPLNINHFDGYNNTKEASTLCSFKPLEHVPELDAGGWHDAGDYDLRIETQSHTTLILALAYEAFDIQDDQTFIDQEHKHVEIHQPDGKPDILQQVEHGVITILGGYRQMGRLYRGIICPSLRQYVMLGDGSVMTDNKVFDDEAQKAKAAAIDELWYKKVANRYSKVFDPEMNLDEIEAYIPDLDDRLVFNEDNPGRQIFGVAALAAAARVLKGYNDELAGECLTVAEALWEENKEAKIEGRRMGGVKVQVLAELILTTGKESYKKELCGMVDVIETNFMFVGWSLGRVMPLIDNKEFQERVTQAARAHQEQLARMLTENPFGCPLDNMEIIGFTQYFYCKGWPEIFSTDNLYAVVNFLLGCHPGVTTNSLVSGIGANSPVIAYGFNRADWSYVPGGTFWNAFNLVRPDLPEDKVWPFLWQEREYIVNGACMYMFTILAADQLAGK
ncbi:MAG: glycoside hydrolase family 9 protein [Sedimentisphaerales bacterium]|nr:glycoside hydrolase family 9 protein [Sedimentisphaerales bacterium]